MLSAQLLHRLGLHRLGLLLTGPLLGGGWQAAFSPFTSTPRPVAPQYVWRRERAMARERDQQQKGAGTADIADLGGDVFKVAQQKIVGTSGSGAGGGGGGSASDGPPPPPSFAQERADQGKGKGKGQQSQTGQGAPGKRKEATSRGNDAERAQPAHKSPKRG